MSKKKLLFSVTKKDLRIDTFRCGGPGGQNQNKRDTGVRITHEPSGAVGESREERTQERNKALAFRKLVHSRKFQTWLRVNAAAVMQGYADLEAMVDRAMDPKNLKVEYGDKH